jgi:hypothetical protein
MVRRRSILATWRHSGNVYVNAREIPEVSVIDLRSDGVTGRDVLIEEIE